MKIAVFIDGSNFYSKSIELKLAGVPDPHFFQFAVKITSVYKNRNFH